MNRSIASTILAAAAIAACASEDPAPADPSASYPTLGAANEEPHDSPRSAGQYRFLYETWGTEINDEWPPADFMIGLMTSEPDVFGDQFAKFGFIRDEHDDLPLGLKRGTQDRARIHETCAMCHVSRLPDGRLWMGAPNLRLDFGRFKVEVSRRWAAAGHPPLMTPLDEKKALSLGPGREGAESSKHPIAVPADFPVYFDLSKRTHLNYMGTGGNVRTEIYFSVFTFGAGAPNDATARVSFPAEEKLAPFVDFFGHMQAPPAPAQDVALVTAGRDVFGRARCDACHHVDDIGRDGVVTLDTSPEGHERLPGEDPKFPNGTIRTSKEHVQLNDPTSEENVDNGYSDLISFMKEHKLQAKYSAGYRPSDLHGLWLTGPYLHNGSVPTLEDLLKPASERPVRFERGGFVIDTTVPGNDNVGHEFGVSLSPEEKTALLAYLRSL